MAAPTEAQVKELFDVHTGAEATGERQARAAALDPNRQWVGPNGYRLSDRLWQGSQAVRGQIDEVLREAIRNGDDALDVAEQLEQFLNPEFAPIRTADGKLVRNQRKSIVTKAPGRGGMGSFPARRLARTEITRIHGEATIFAAERTPFALGVKWNLSGRHPKPDECDRNATRDVGLGPGVYPPKDVPRYPSHPQDLCNLSVATVDDVDAVVDQLRAQYNLSEGVGAKPPASIPSSFRAEFDPSNSKVANDWLERGNNVDDPSTRDAAKRKIEQELGNRLANDPKARAAFQKLRDYEYPRGFRPTTDDEWRTELGKRASEYVSNWAATSGDSQSRAIASQLAAKAEFKLKDAKMWFKKDDITQARKQFGHEMPLMQRVHRAQYEWTQDEFKKAGIKEVHLVRGSDFKKGTYGWQTDPRLLVEDITVGVELQPMSSFTTRLATAEEFAGGGLVGSASDHVVFSTAVPASQILSTARTGFGCLNEYEFVVMGGRGEWIVTKV